MGLHQIKSFYIAGKKKKKHTKQQNKKAAYRMRKKFANYLSDKGC